MLGFGKKDQVYSEIELANQLGVRAEDLKDIRYELLVQDEDWKMVHREIVLTHKGLKKMLAALDARAITSGSRGFGKANMKAIEKTVPEQSEKALGAALIPYDRKRTVFVKRFHMNKRIISCQDAEGEWYRLRINPEHADKFVMEMELPVRIIDQDLVELTRAAPRRRGKW